MKTENYRVPQVKIEGVDGYTFEALVIGKEITKGKREGQFIVKKVKIVSVFSEKEGIHLTDETFDPFEFQGMKFAPEEFQKLSNLFQKEVETQAQKELSHTIWDYRIVNPLIAQGHRDSFDSFFNN